MKKSILSVGLSSLALSLAAMTPLHAESAEPRVAKIIEISGKAVVERNGHRYTALQGMLLQEGDKVSVLEGSKVNLKYSSCSSDVTATMQVVISEANQCPAGKVASASDLQAPKTSASKIQRIDPNLAEAACNTCKVQLASGVPAIASAGFGSAGKVVAGVLGAGGVASAVSSGGSSSSLSSGGTTTPTATTPTTTPSTPTSGGSTPSTPTGGGSTPSTPTGGGASNVPVSPP